MWPFSRKQEELEVFLDWELIEDQSKKIAFKKHAVDSVINFIARTIIMSEFRVKKNKEYILDEMYYRFNVKPNINQSASAFWKDVIHKLIYDGECLIIKTDTNDLLVAENYERVEYAVYQDKFKNVVVKDYQFDKTFFRDEVMFLEYGNEKLSKLIDGLFYDYGELFGRIVEFQLRKNQIRATVDIEGTFKKQIDDDEENGERKKNPLQEYIDKAYKAIRERTVAIIPQQKGFTYTEHSKNQTGGASVDEINKVTDGFLEQVCRAVGLPPNLLKGDLADVEKVTKNYLMFCIDPILEIIENEMNAQFISKTEYLKGDRIKVRRARYRDIFDLAIAIDKLISSGAFNGNEIRDEVGYEMTDEEIHKKYFITKNYQESSQALEGGGDDD